MPPLMKLFIRVLKILMNHLILLIVNKTIHSHIQLSRKYSPKYHSSASYCSYSDIHFC